MEQKNPHSPRALTPFELTRARYVGICGPQEFSDGKFVRPVQFVRVAREPYLDPDKGLMVDFESGSGSPDTRLASDIGLVPDADGTWNGYVMATTPY